MSHTRTHLLTTTLCLGGWGTTTSGQTNALRDARTHLGCIGEDKVQARVPIGRSSRLWQEALSDVHHHAVNLAHVHVLHGRVPHDLTVGTPTATPQPMCA
jgi:hypothetical protein